MAARKLGSAEGPEAPRPPWLRSFTVRTKYGATAPYMDGTPNCTIETASVMAIATITVLTENRDACLQTTWYTRNAISTPIRSRALKGCPGSTKHNDQIP